jgi:putative transposon-encoded protein
MAKIKVTNEIKEMDGEVIEKTVTPFSGSAHISFPKKHTGKMVNVIVPTTARYTWVFSRQELADAIKSCRNVLKSQKESKLTFHKEQCITNLSQKTFSLQDLSVVLSLLQEDKSKCQLAKRIKDTYNL